MDHDPVVVKFLVLLTLVLVLVPCCSGWLHAHPPRLLGQAAAPHRHGTGPAGAWEGALLPPLLLLLL
jgi:hypothetical protein